MRTSSEWQEYYEANARSLLEIPWERGADLTHEETRAVSRSLKEFQAGERSEGRHLLRHAHEYAARTGDCAYVSAIRLFIAEEQRHSRDLARFLTLNGVPLVNTTFTDRVFRSLRHSIGSLEVSIGLLITAEIIAKVCYAALREATNSLVLRRLCDRILQDESFHVEFQSAQLFGLRSNRNAVGHWLTMSMQRVLYVGTVVVVWLFHRTVIVRASLSFAAWWNSCWTEFRDAFAPREPNKPDPREPRERVAVPRPVPPGAGSVIPSR